MQHNMAILDARGETALTWDTKDEASTEAVKDEFDKMMAKGFMAYSDGTPTRTFDQEAEEIIVSPVIAGG